MPRFSAVQFQRCPAPSLSRFSAVERQRCPVQRFHLYSAAVSAATPHSATDRKSPSSPPLTMLHSAAILSLPPAAPTGKTLATAPAPSPSLFHASSPASAASSPSTAASRTAPSPPPPPPSTPPASRTTPSAHPVYCSAATVAHRLIAQPLPAWNRICNRTRNDGSGSQSSAAIGGEEAVFQREICGVMQEIIRKEVRNYMVGMEMEKKGHYMQSDAMMINGVIKRMGMSKVD
ncbi:pectinesterase inhibitor 10-like [Salvia miltiorrhiza]|uniref:pectinesterase inhibitor 10-like n=1 Tax=Salvia miltiorrhiza TaxID=226208 RepID=UPI0025AC77B8|nr:pectinesterase inhibitor 10-like [Salvia miltiorrhiza]